MSTSFQLNEVSRIPSATDNLAIAVRRIEKGSRVSCEDGAFTLSHTVLEGHRFAVRPIPRGSALLSWGLPFGIAVHAISPGTYACNASILAVLRDRSIDFELPTEPNFEDHIQAYRLDESSFRPGVQVARHATPRTFLGYRRAGGRGTGTRNCIVLLGTTSRTASYVRQLERRLRGTAFPNIDGIVAIAHTEGGGTESPNNLDLLLQTLAGYIVNPNVGALLAVDYGTEPLTNALLERTMRERRYPLDSLLYRFLTLRSGFQKNLEQGEAIVRGWLEPVSQMRRVEAPASELKIGLQCGGSDAFSGISSNPLLSWVAKEVVQNGGIANLAETDELIGAESYVLKNVRDLETARRFLAMIERFKERTRWHGTSAEGNPSGGNKLRGLYNIVLKSIGAANKLHPEVRLDYAIEYGERMLEPGFCFMDSPGNDLESVAGQVSAGANMIFFTTGNGSITNFPFVPTIKIMNTTRRYDLLSREMDVNAGAYLDGTPMEELGREMFELALAIASGQRSKGELAGHAQTSIWRNWKQTDDSQVETLLHTPLPVGRNIAIRPDGADSSVRFEAVRFCGRTATDHVALILPTSLCSSQIARLSVDRLNEKAVGKEQGLSRFVSLQHTEGCGLSGGITEEMHTRTLLGYLSHPLVRFALLLEHGCEKMHNDFMRHQAERQGIDLSGFGWASVQLDGGIERVTQKIEDWFRGAISNTSPPAVEPVGLGSLRLGLTATGVLQPEAAASLAEVARTIVAGGGTVVVPHNSELLSAPVFLESTVGSQSLEPSLAYGQQASTPGFHIMETPTDHWVETLTGLGATGVEIFLAHVAEQPRQGHPLVPLVQVSAEPSLLKSASEDIDLRLEGDTARWTAAILQQVLAVASRRYTPKALLQGNHDFQLTRGLLGISL
ncbi:MAG: altronate dehydratase [Acidimicrobiia bacterium]|nr:altronate dehydratase [Acidimicrobiia bacterium]